MSEKEKLINDISKIKDVLVDYIDKSSIKNKDTLKENTIKIFTDFEEKLKNTKIEKSELSCMDEKEIENFINYYKTTIKKGKGEIKKLLKSVDNNYEKAIELFKIKEKKK